MVSGARSSRPRSSRARSSCGGRDERGRNVARYYDSNTRRFLALGGGARSHSIHRALWGPAIADADGAANYVNVLIGDAIESLKLPAKSTVLDLGCGVGGTLFALARRFPQSSLNGVTISPRQYTLALKLADQLGLGPRCTFHCGDFESIALDVHADVIVAVESMVHARSMPAFLGNASRHLAVGGTLVVVDDFVSAVEAPVGAAREVLDDFRKGWHLSSLTTVPAFAEAAAAAGFELAEMRDLSPMIRTDRPRDRAIALIGPLLRRLAHVPMFANLVGGAALTRGLRAGTLGYHWVRLKR